MIASLSMYERPETINALHTLWLTIRDTLKSNGIAAPDKLAQRATDMDTWLNEALLLSQACGLPYRAALHDQVQLVGAPDL